MNFTLHSLIESITKTHCGKKNLSFLTSVFFLKRSRCLAARTDYFETSISSYKLFQDFRDGVSNRCPVPSNICSERTLDHHSNFFFSNKETVVRNVSPSEALPIFVELKLADNVFKTCHYIV